MTDKEALKQLIEDLISMMEYHVEQTRPIHTTTVALQAAREALKALAQPEQKPVAKYSDIVSDGGLDPRNKFDTTPPQPEQDTVQRLSALIRAQQITIDKLEAQLEQVPVAVYGYCPQCGAKGAMRERRPNGNDKCANGHTYPSSTSTPPQRKPLTDEEIDELSRSMVKGDKSVNWLCRAIEAAHGIQEDK